MIEKYKKGDQLLLLTYFDNFDFYCTLLLKMGPIQFFIERKPKIFL
jgi:hypothetical protein